MNSQRYTQTVSIELELIHSKIQKTYKVFINLSGIFSHYQNCSIIVLAIAKNAFFFCIK